MTRKISDMINDLQKILEENGDLYLIYSSDAEGNYYEGIWQKPSLGHFDSEENEFKQQEHTNLPINSVCIN